MNKVKLSIIILNWNTKALLQQCLLSVISNQQSDDNKELSANSKQRKKLATDNRSLVTEIIVVDNGSVDGSVLMVKKQFPQVRLIENKENVGFAKGNNIGIKEAKGQYLMLLNSDTIVQKEAIEKLVNYLEKNPNFAVSPLLQLPNGEPQSEYYMRFPNLWQILFYHNPIIRPFILKTPLKKIICQEPKKEPFEVDQLPGAALMTSQEVWQKVGGLDPDYQFLLEDVDWSWRAKKAGIKLMVIPQAKIVHIGGASWKKKLDIDKNAFYKQFFASMLLFVERNYNSFSLFAFKFALLLNFLLTLKIPLFLSLVKGDFKQEKLWQ
jgi:GT2 family glycosyltransferase